MVFWASLSCSIPVSAETNRQFCDKVAKFCAKVKIAMDTLLMFLMSEHALYKKSSFHSEFLQQMWSNQQFPADLVTFTEEILHGKLHFLCSDCIFYVRHTMLRCCLDCICWWLFILNAKVLYMTTYKLSVSVRLTICSQCTFSLPREIIRKP